MGWVTLEKEAFAVLATPARSHWPAAYPESFDLYTDHSNLMFLFDPAPIMPNIDQAAIRKLLHWVVQISVYNYIFLRICEEESIWPDLFTRWTASLTIRHLVDIPPHAKPSKTLNSNLYQG